MDLATVERAFGELLAAVGDIVVARSRGAPAEPGGGSTRALARRYRARRRAFDDALEALGAADPPKGDNARALANMRSALEWLDELEPTPGARPVTGGVASEDPATARARAALYRRYGEAVTSVRLGNETFDRLTVLARLASEPDAATRRRLFESLAPIWRTVDGDGEKASPYRRLLGSSAARWQRAGSPVEASAVALGLPAGSLEGTLQAVLEAWRRVMGPERVEPWDYWYTVGAAARRLDRRLPADRLLDLNGRYLASLGADPARLGIVYDVLPRPGRPTIPVAFTMGMGGWARDQPVNGPWTPRPPWVFGTYREGGLGNLLELFHESGHAVHMAAVRTRPGFLDWSLADTAYLEGTADVLGWDTDEPAWQRHWLGDAAEPREAVLSRYGAVMLDVCWALFEIELHRHPERRPNDVWAEVTAEGLGLEPHPEWSWWALRGQLIDLPGYMANYALSALMAAAVRDRILAVRGPWFAGDPGWYEYVADALFVAGASRTPAELLGDVLGRPLTAEPLLADLRRIG
jgi:hypothetical protein